MVGVAQRLAHWFVVPVVGGSNPLAHPKQNLYKKVLYPKGFFVSNYIDHAMRKSF